MLTCDIVESPSGDVVRLALLDQRVTFEQEFKQQIAEIDCGYYVASLIDRAQDGDGHF